MPRKAPEKRSQPTASKKEASNVNASSKNRPANPNQSAPASKSKSSSNSVDALVKKQLASLRQADTLFKDAVSIVEIYRKKHPELDSYIPSVESTQREIKVRDASSEDSNQRSKCFRDPEGSVMPPMTASCCMRDLILSQDLERRPGW
jgi:hypothetical protein